MSDASNKSGSRSRPDWGGAVLLVLLLAAVVLKAYDHFTEEPPPRVNREWTKEPGRDIGPRMHEHGRPAMWDSSSIQLGDTEYKASVGYSRYQDEDNDDPDYYSIDVERPSGERSWGVWFQRDFPANEIADDVGRKQARDIVSYDEQTRVVTFDLGAQRFTYKLP